MSTAVIDPILEEEVQGKAYDARLLGRLWGYVAPYKLRVAVTLSLVAPMFLLELAPAWIIKTGMDRIFAPNEAAITGPAFLQALLEPPGGLPSLYWLGALMFVAMLLTLAFQVGNMYVMASTGQAAMRDLRQTTFRHIQSLQLGFFDSYPVGRLVTRTTNDAENLAEMFSAGIVALVVDVAKMIGFAVVLFSLDAELATVAFLLVPFLAACAILFRFKVREAFRAVRVRIARINVHIQETITGMKVVQLFARERRNLRDFDAMNASHRDAWQDSIHYEAMLFSVVEAATSLTTAIIVYYGTRDVVVAGTLFLFIDYMRRFFMPLRDLSAKYSVMQSSMASAERIFQLLDVEPAIRDRPDARAPARRPGGEAGEVVFEDVWFAYGEGAAELPDDSPEWVLRGISFRVAAGQKVAFVGATGAGKTTIIKLLTRLYEVTRGRILVDGVDIRDFPQMELRRRVATVLQDVALFRGSVADNVRLGRDDVDRETVERCARAVEADRFIARLPEGYDTEVRERGTNFSAGQRQLLSFARALAHGADILVLDEATSSIDSETEAMIQRGLHVLMEQQTSLAIAHRLSTIRDVDTIYVLDGGRLVEQGRHEELLARGGLYDRLYRLQMKEDARAGEGA